jgi:hypothetical protein
VFGSVDQSTSDFGTAHRRWDRFFESLDFTVIPDAGHYFIKNHAAELAMIIGRNCPTMGR